MLNSWNCLSKSVSERNGRHSCQADEGHEKAEHPVLNHFTQANRKIAG